MSSGGGRKGEEGLERAWRGLGEGLARAWRGLGEGLTSAWRVAGEERTTTPDPPLLHSFDLSSHTPLTPPQGEESVDYTYIHIYVSTYM